MDGPGRERIFLYGTLRRGGSRDVLKYYEGATFVGTARVRGVLYDLGDYPGLRLSETADWVGGELFDVTAGALARLDEWEGLDLPLPGGNEYRRVRTIAHCDEEVSECWIYEIDTARCDGHPVIVTGDWLANRRSS